MTLLAIKITLIGLLTGTIGLLAAIRCFDIAHDDVPLWLNLGVLFAFLGGFGGAFFGVILLIASY